MPTIKQEKAFENIVENGGNVSKGMRDAGYSEKTAKTPQKLTESKGWEELIEENLPDSILAKVHKEGLKAVTPKEKAPDYSTRHRYLETAYKLKNKIVEHTTVDVKSKIVRTDE